MKNILLVIACLFGMTSSSASDAIEPFEFVLNVEDGVYHKTVTKWTKSLHKVSTVGSTTYFRKQAKKDKLHS